MKKPFVRNLTLVLGVIFAFLLIAAQTSADPSRYPQFAQYHLPEGVTPDFIHLDDLVDEIIQKRKPMIIDVRSREEYTASHIKGSVSIPLDEISSRLDEIPKDKPLVLY
jgi:3-mercaptopyruvate sulfurtransferase SseA